MSRWIKGTLLSAALLLVAPEAEAGNPCQQDARRLCPAAHTPRDKAQCLAGKWSDVSQACKDKIQKRSGGGGKRKRRR